MSVEMQINHAAGDPGKSSRRYQRTIFSVPVTLRHLMAGGVRSSPGISLDLSEGGMGAIVQGGLKVGDTVGIDLRVSDTVIRAIAIVRHTSSVRSGFEFVGLTPEERLRISSACGHN